MKHASALIFPETEPSLHFLADLLVFFDSLSWYLPTESAPSDHENYSFLAEFCSPYVPVPLTGEDLFRFNRLMREMETSRPDELSRLFSASAAPLTTGQVRDLDETSSAGVYASLHKNAEAKANIRLKERLWQARLILKLAEILDKRETEIKQGLARISTVEQKLYASLEGDDETVSADPVETNGLNKLKDRLTGDISSTGPSSLVLTLRLKAWSEVYLADMPEQQAEILVAADREYGSVLLEGYENIRQQPPEKLFSLPLPVFDFADSNDARSTYLAGRKNFREAAYDNIKYLTNYLKTAAAQDFTQSPAPERPALLTENLALWQKKQEQYFPASANIFKQLDFYCFPGLSFAELFQQIFRLEAPIKKNRYPSPTCILAVPVS